MLGTDFAPCSASRNNDALALGGADRERGASQGDLTAVGAAALNRFPFVGAVLDVEGLGQVCQSLQGLSVAVELQPLVRARPGDRSARGFCWRGRNEREKSHACGSIFACPHVRTLGNARGNCHSGSSPPQEY